MTSYSEYLAIKCQSEPHLNSTNIDDIHYKRTILFKETLDKKIHESFSEELINYFIEQSMTLKSSFKVAKPSVPASKMNQEDPTTTKPRKAKPVISFGQLISFKLDFFKKANSMKDRFYQELIKNSSMNVNLDDSEKIFNFISRTVNEFCIEEVKKAQENSDDGQISTPDDIATEEFELDEALLNKLENDAVEKYAFGPEYIDSELVRVGQYYYLNGAMMTEEPVQVLYKLAGGSIGQIKNVTKRLKENPNYTKAQKIRERKIYNVVKLVCQSKEEKAKNLPISLKVRDYGKNGGLMIPKPELLPFIRLVINLVRKYTSVEAFKLNKLNMIKFCKEKIQSNLTTLWVLFCKGLPEGCSPCDDGVKDFFAVFLRKLINSRIQEFISSYLESSSKEALKLGKGGQTLRDKLYAAVTENKKLKEEKKVGSTKKEQRSKKKRDNINEAEAPKKKKQNTKNMIENPRDDISDGVSSQVQVEMNNFKTNSPGKITRKRRKPKQCNNKRMNQDDATSPTTSQNVDVTSASTNIGNPSKTTKDNNTKTTLNVNKPQNVDLRRSKRMRKIKLFND